ncbi:MAG TPA: DUF1844 domain-containing protein [Gemmatimonadota bacterium]|jgi:hypothetical protein|nr:DUF1844 domain-containing protein [Gemmatimonadota bacterium]
MTESRFRERRSAHRDETDAEPAAPAAPTDVSDAPAAPAVEIAPPDAEPEPTADPASVGSPSAGDEIAAYLDQMAQMDPPEPSFLELIGPHIEEALRYLGELPLTPEGERRVLPRWAKREIDLLGIVEQRTQGNLPPDEQEYLRRALDHLRTMYLKVSP